MKKDELLVPRLDFLIPMSFFLSQEWKIMFGVGKAFALGRVVELHPAWAIEVVNNLEHRLEDVLHDFKGIYAEDEHFVPRISTDFITMSREYTFNDVWDYIVEQGIAQESELKLVCHLMGKRVEHLNEIIDVRTGYQDIEQHKWALDA